MQHLASISRSSGSRSSSSSSSRSGSSSSSSSSNRRLGRSRVRAASEGSSEGSSSTSDKLNIYTLSHEDLSELLTSWGQPKFRVKQVSDWLFDKGVRSFDDMVNVPKSLRELLETHTTIGALEVAEEQVSKDGTVRVSTLRPLLTAPALDPLPPPWPLYRLSCGLYPSSRLPCVLRSWKEED